MARSAPSVRWRGGLTPCGRVLIFAHDHLGEGMKILLVDDSATELNRLKQIVERAGHQVITAKDGAEGIEKAKSESPQLIFMDIVMPRIDGFKATRMLSADPETASIPIVLVSTKNEAVDIAWARRQGAVHLIGKPYATSEILEQLAAFQR